jgi:hypothetical protein
MERSYPEEKKVPSPVRAGLLSRPVSQAARNASVADHCGAFKKNAARRTQHVSRVSSVEESESSMDGLGPQGIGTQDEAKLAGLFVLIAQHRVGNRPGGCEPLAVKRRPKPFPLLTKPRTIARAEILNNGHPKTLK